MSQGLLFDTGDIRRAAVFSSCEVFRYTLERYWNDDLPRLLFILLNPSIADATRDDPTNRRGIGFARLWGFGSIIFVNLFAFRSPKPKVMKAYHSPIGPDNDRHILEQVKLADRVVLAWGNDGGWIGRDRQVRELLAGVECYRFGTTKVGHPRHPLYLRTDQPLELVT